MLRGIILVALVAAVSLPLAGGASPASPRATREATAYGQWNGVVSFNIVSNYAVPGTKTTSEDSRVYTVHGTNATMTGQGRLNVLYTGGVCGAISDGWGWKGSGSVPSPSVVIDNGGFSFSFAPVDALYVYTASGNGDGPGEGVCDQPRGHPAAAKLGTGIGQFGWNKAGKRTHLLRTSGSMTVSGKGGGNPNALPGSLSYPAVIKVTWSLRRIGEDRDHDGIADDNADDPNIYDPDSDNDHCLDGVELDNGTNPNNRRSHPAHCRQGAPDSDGDGWSDAQETAQGTDPYNKRSKPKDPPKPPKPPKQRPPLLPPDPHGWVPYSNYRTCAGNTIITQRCHVLLSPSATIAMAATIPAYESPTVEQSYQMCTKYLLLPNPVDCLASNVYDIGAQASFSLGVKLAAQGGYCFFFDQSRTRIPLPQRVGGNVYTGWENSYNQGDYELRQGETKVFDGIQLRCGKPGVNDRWMYRYFP